MTKMIYKTKVYEKYTGEGHTFEVFETTVGAPYIIMLDGSFLATAETGIDISEEITDTIKWFDWTKTNPNVA